MTPDYEADGVRLYRGDCQAVLPTLAAGSVDAVVCDPPAGISMMGAGWDTFPLRDRGPLHGTPEHAAHRHGRGFANGMTYDKTPKAREAFVAFLSGVMRECLRVLKPGGYALVWAFPRTSHWTGTAVEEAGFEVRDRISHLFGQGMPKGKGCLKPACEDWWLARKPGPRVLPLNVEECRVGTGADKGEWPATGRAVHQSAYNASRDGSRAAPAVTDRTAGRWPANVVLQHHETCRQVGVKRVKGSNVPGPGRTDGPKPGSVYGTMGDSATFHYGDADGMETVEAWECHPTLCPVALLDAQAGERPTGHLRKRAGDPVHDNWRQWEGRSDERFRTADYEHAGDSGGPSRFFYCSKASKSDRGDGNRHPCVKPQTLMKWLVGLVSFPGETVLDPFMGSGTTGLACLTTGRNFVGVELDPGYHEVARKRLAGAHGPLFAPREVTA
jgi:DNA modification methylase